MATSSLDVPTLIEFCKDHAAALYPEHQRQDILVVTPVLDPGSCPNGWCNFVAVVATKRKVETVRLMKMPLDSPRPISDALYKLLRDLQEEVDAAMGTWT